MRHSIFPEERAPRKIEVVNLLAVADQATESDNGVVGELSALVEKGIHILQRNVTLSRR